MDRELKCSCGNWQCPNNREALLKSFVYDPKKWSHIEHPCTLRDGTRIEKDIVWEIFTCAVKACLFLRDNSIHYEINNRRLYDTTERFSWDLRDPDNSPQKIMDEIRKAEKSIDGSLVYWFRNHVKPAIRDLPEILFSRDAWMILVFREPCHECNRKRPLTFCEERHRWLCDRCGE